MSSSATGTVLGGRYRLVAPIGAGGMGEVYAAIDERIGGQVAVKMLPPGEADSVALQRFRREARAAAALGNPHIVRVTDFHEQPGEPPFIVMEKVEGVSLRQLVSREGRLPPRRACTIAAQILSALSAAHEAGILHRDIKPANVLVMASPAGDLVKVADFGLARLLDHAETAPVQGALPARLKLTGTDDVVGTIGFIAPEYLRQEPGDGRADLYAVGATLFQMLCGRRPFEGMTSGQYIAAALETVPRLDASLGIDPKLVDVVWKAMALRPDDRFGSASAFMVALEPWVDDTMTVTTQSTLPTIPLAAKPEAPPATPIVTPRPSAHHPQIFWILTFMLVAFMGIVVWYAWYVKTNNTKIKRLGDDVQELQ